MSHLMPTLSGDVSRILLFLKAIRYGRYEEILPEFLLTVKNLSFAPGGPKSNFATEPPLVHDSTRCNKTWSPIRGSATMGGSMSNTDATHHWWWGNVPETAAQPGPDPPGHGCYAG